MKKNILPFFLVIFILFSILPSSCVEDNFAQEEAFQNAVDTIYNRRIKSFNKELDSICTYQMDSLVNSKVDSIRKQRLEEIEDLINKGKGK